MATTVKARRAKKYYRCDSTFNSNHVLRPQPTWWHIAPGDHYALLTVFPDDDAYYWAAQSPHQSRYCRECAGTYWPELLPKEEKSDAR